jgi:hypothetical protein
MDKNYLTRKRGEDKGEWLNEKEGKRAIDVLYQDDDLYENEDPNSRENNPKLYRDAELRKELYLQMLINEKYYASIRYCRDMDKRAAEDAEAVVPAHKNLD